MKALTGELGGKPLIGFAGGPFTLASYLIEGGPSKNHDRTKALMYGHPELWHALMGRLAAIATAFLAGAGGGGRVGGAAVRLLGRRALPEDYRHAILPHTRRIFAALAPSGVPRIHFGVGTGELLGLLGEAGAEWSASTGGSRSTRAPAGSAPARRSRATSTPRWRWPPGT